MISSLMKKSSLLINKAKKFWKARRVALDKAAADKAATDRETADNANIGDVELTDMSTTTVGQAAEVSDSALDGALGHDTSAVSSAASAQVVTAKEAEALGEGGDGKGGGDLDA